MMKNNLSGKYSLTITEKRRILTTCFDETSLPNVKVGLKMLYDGSACPFFIDIKNQDKAIKLISNKAYLK